MVHHRFNLLLDELGEGLDRALPSVLLLHQLAMTEQLQRGIFGHFVALRNGGLSVAIHGAKQYFARVFLNRVIENKSTCLDLFARFLENRLQDLRETTPLRVEVDEHDLVLACNAWLCWGKLTECHIEVGPVQTQHRSLCAEKKTDELKNNINTPNALKIKIKSQTEQKRLLTHLQPE